MKLTILTSPLSLLMARGCAHHSNVRRQTCPGNRILELPEPGVRPAEDEQERLYMHIILSRSCNIP